MKKLFGLILVSPILLHETSTIYGDSPNLSIRWVKHKSAGTMGLTTSCAIEICTKTKSTNGHLFTDLVLWDIGLIMEEVGYYMTRVYNIVVFGIAKLKNLAK